MTPDDNGAHVRLSLLQQKVQNTVKVFYLHIDIMKDESMAVPIVSVPKNFNVENFQ